MIIPKRTTSTDKNFQTLVKELDAELKILDGEDHSFYDQFNKIDSLKYVVVAYDQDNPVGCGAIKEFAQDTMEVKRMYVPLNKRGLGIATIILTELENRAREVNFKKCILETGKKQPAAIRLYQKNDYTIIPNFSPYEADDNSVCFEKELT